MTERISLMKNVKIRQMVLDRGSQSLTTGRPIGIDMAVRHTLLVNKLFIIRNVAELFTSHFSYCLWKIFSQELLRHQQLPGFNSITHIWFLVLYRMHTRVFYSTVIRIRYTSVVTIKNSKNLNYFDELSCLVVFLVDNFGKFPKNYLACNYLVVRTVYVLTPCEL